MAPRRTGEGSSSHLVVVTRRERVAVPPAGRLVVESRRRERGGGEEDLPGTVKRSRGEVIEEVGSGQTSPPMEEGIIGEERSGEEEEGLWAIEEDSAGDKARGRPAPLVEYSAADKGAEGEATGEEGRSERRGVSSRGHGDEGITEGGDSTGRGGDGPGCVARAGEGIVGDGGRPGGEKEDVGECWRRDSPIKP
ncbi:unnamed protein product [Linum trigynum]|uniref:Pr1-like protein n=1 Tax=Linum trigynum TaxID=586398 RepID=A0AAV2DBL2_9ROSI